MDERTIILCICWKKSDASLTFVKTANVTLIIISFKKKDKCENYLEPISLHKDHLPLHMHSLRHSLLDSSVKPTLLPDLSTAQTSMPKTNKWHSRLFQKQWRSSPSGEWKCLGSCRAWLHFTSPIVACQVCVFAVCNLQGHVFVIACVFWWSRWFTIFDL